MVASAINNLRYNFYVIGKKGSDHKGSHHSDHKGHKNDKGQDEHHGHKSEHAKKGKKNVYLFIYLFILNLTTNEIK